jgi:hypothetical protein
MSHVVLTQWCHSGVTVVSQWCHSGVTVVSQWCRSGVSLVQFISTAGLWTNVTAALVSGLAVDA